MKIEKLLIAAGALSLMTSVAYADNNEIYLDQTGTSNTVDTNQSGNRNKIGVLPGAGENGNARARQAGTLNELIINQSGNGNVASSRNSGIDQLGAENFLRIEQAGNSGEVAGVAQFGRDSEMRIIQRAGSNRNLVLSAVQDTQLAPTTSPTNFMRIVQEGGNNNEVSRASQDGNGNDMRLRQDGSRNLIGRAIQGDFNSSDSAPGYEPNTYDATMAITQIGNDNVVVEADQDGSGNSMVFSVDGNSNGTAAFDSAAVIAAANAAVGQGSLAQGGDGNMMNVSLTGNFNSFSFAQMGSGDTLVGTGLGSNNQIATNQFGGSGNSINFEIVGNGNELGLSQTGTGNGIQSSQVGNNNIASLNQGGTGNNSSISQN